MLAKWTFTLLELEILYGAAIDHANFLKQHDPNHVYRRLQETVKAARTAVVADSGIGNVGDGVSLIAVETRLRLCVDEVDTLIRAAEHKIYKVQHPSKRLLRLRAEAEAELAAATTDAQRRESERALRALGVAVGDFDEDVYVDETGDTNDVVVVRVLERVLPVLRAFLQEMRSVVTLRLCGLKDRET